MRLGPSSVIGLMDVARRTPLRTSQSIRSCDDGAHLNTAGLQGVNAVILILKIKIIDRRSFVKRLLVPFVVIEIAQF